MRTRRRYSAVQLGLPNGPISSPGGSPVMKSWSSLPPNMATTAPGRSLLRILLRTSVNQLKTSGRSSPVAIRPSTLLLASIARFPATARRSDSPGTITSESPTVQSRSGWDGEKRVRRGGTETGVCGLTSDVGGTATAVSITSSPERPSAAFSPRRGSSRSKAWLTFASGPDSRSARSRFHPCGCPAADLWMPGAFSTAPSTSATSATTNAEPAEWSRRPPSAVRSSGRLRLWGRAVGSIRTGSR